MESMNPLLKYFAANGLATFCGIIYWMTIENFQQRKIGEEKQKYFALVMILSLLLTPIGAWVVSMLSKLRRLAPAIKEAGN
jgi:hypothetical protein